MKETHEKGMKVKANSFSEAQRAKENLYTAEDVGCYVDGARGIYAIDAIVEFAESHGMADQTCDTSNHTHEETHDDSRFAGCEFAGEIEDEIDDFMNTTYPVNGAYWGRNENSDWGLWTIENEAAQ
jgi:hypothetical protein